MPLTEIDSNTDPVKIQRFREIVEASERYNQGVTIQKLRSHFLRRPVASKVFLFESVDYDFVFAGKYNQEFGWRCILLGFDRRNGTNKQVIRDFLTKLNLFLDARGIDSIYFIFPMINSHPVSDAIKRLIKQEWPLNNLGNAVTTRRVDSEYFLKEETSFEFFGTEGYGYGSSGGFGIIKAEKITLHRNLTP